MTSGTTVGGVGGSAIHPASRTIAASKGKRQRVNVPRKADWSIAADRSVAEE